MRRSSVPVVAGRVLDGQQSFGRARDESAAWQGLVARSPAMAALWRIVDHLAPAARATLVTGDTGTGKTLLADVALRLGPCRGEPVVVLDPAADAHALRRLRQTAAGSRTPVSCAVSDLTALSPDAQAILARALANAEARDPGQGLHVIAVSRVDPQEAVHSGRVDPRLYYRLATARYHMPPLAARVDDIPDLAAVFLREASRRSGLAPRTLTAAATDVLVARTWPGNARELRNVVTRAAALADDGVIGVQTIREACGLDAVAAPARQGRLPERDLADLHRVSAALSSTGGNKSAAALQLGVSRRSFYRMLERLGA
ncbi:MAG: sigma 54-interacting transcriptional regulator [Vicinamibacterales bacterium]